MSTATKPTITCAPSGPYLVKGLTQLRNSKHEDLPTKETTALCRCGASGNKPFCDGTHAAVGFDDTRAAAAPPTHERDRYEGDSITILDNRAVCSHAGFCTTGLSAVWRMKQEPWIDPDAADREAIIDTINQCPSGALSYQINGTEEPRADVAPAILVSENGPYHVVGGLPLDGSTNGQKPQLEALYALCRCGHSKNKPFCDGAHWAVKFSDDKN